MFVTAIHRKRPEPNKSRSIRVLCGGDGEILNLLAPLGASRAEEFSRPFLSCGLQRLQATFHLSQQKKHCCSSAFCGGDGGMPFMYTTSPRRFSIIPFLDSHASQHCPANTGTQTQGFVVALCHMPYCEHRRRQPFS